MPREGRRRVPKQRPRAKVFLNLPYDPKFENLFLSYICSIHAFGMIPRVTLEIPGGMRRLDRIFELIQSCEYSVHDLSRVQLDRAKPRTPRFNMPFELGLAVAWQKVGDASHVWFVMEAVNYRLAKSLSDLSGTDAYIHNGTIKGVFREMGNALVRKGRKPGVLEMWRIYRAVREKIPVILGRCGAQSVFEARVFREISFAAKVAAGGIVR
jgi:hypothetical protein